MGDAEGGTGGGDTRLGLLTGAIGIAARTFASAHEVGCVLHNAGRIDLRWRRTPQASYGLGAGGAVHKGGSGCPVSAVPRGPRPSQQPV